MRDMIKENRRQAAELDAIRVKFEGQKEGFRYLCIQIDQCYHPQYIREAYNWI